jgi:hypothetical protein
MSENKYIDVLCARTRSPSVLNALHACREDHPLGHSHKWRDAYAVVCQHTASFAGCNISRLRWLAEMEAA